MAVRSRATSPRASGRRRGHRRRRVGVDAAPPRRSWSRPRRRPWQRSMRSATACSFGLIAGTDRAHRLYPTGRRLGPGVGDDPDRGQGCRPEALGATGGTAIGRWLIEAYKLVRVLRRRDPPRHPADRRQERERDRATTSPPRSLAARARSSATAAGSASTGASPSCAGSPRRSSAPSTSSPGRRTSPPTSTR